MQEQSQPFIATLSNIPNLFFPQKNGDEKAHFIMPRENLCKLITDMGRTLRITGEAVDKLQSAVKSAVETEKTKSITEQETSFDILANLLKGEEHKVFKEKLAPFLPLIENNIPVEKRAPGMNEAVALVFLKELFNVNGTSQRFRGIDREDLMHMMRDGKRDGVFGPEYFADIAEHLKLDTEYEIDRITETELPIKINFQFKLAGSSVPANTTVFEIKVPVTYEIIPADNGHLDITMRCDKDKIEHGDTIFEQAYADHLKQNIALIQAAARTKDFSDIPNELWNINARYKQTNEPDEARLSARKEELDALSLLNAVTKAKEEKLPSADQDQVTLLKLYAEATALMQRTPGQASEAEAYLQAINDEATIKNALEPPHQTSLQRLIHPYKKLPSPDMMHLEQNKADVKKRSKLKKLINLASVVTTLAIVTVGALAAVINILTFGTPLIATLAGTLVAGWGGSRHLQKTVNNNMKDDAEWQREEAGERATEDARTEAGMVAGVNPGAPGKAKAEATVDAGAGAEAAAAAAAAAEAEAAAEAAAAAEAEAAAAAEAEAAAAARTTTGTRAGAGAPAKKSPAGSDTKWPPPRAPKTTRPSSSHD